MADPNQLDLFRASEELKREQKEGRNLAKYTSIKYKLPGRTISPAKMSKEGLQNWIVEFAKLNNIDLPKGFYGRNRTQILGMYKGMQETYNFSDRDILPKKNY
ncbi:MAG: hypothetical protein Q7S33_05360 [Nanoarchaeota archaeon]|nr:hypothetical protein [Nanoarchaeota archaeon]